MDSFCENIADRMPVSMECWFAQEIYVSSAHLDWVEERMSIRVDEKPVG
jgi:hypothetical protein